MAKRWYIVQAYSNFERKVAESIQEKVVASGLDHLFENVLVPTEKVVEVRRGRKVDAERKFFPGYVLVKMELTDETFHLIKNTPKVTGFLGSEHKPIPISEAEANSILHQVQEGVERPKPQSALKLVRAFACRMVHLPALTVWLKRLMKSALASRLKFLFLAGLPRLNWNMVRLKKPNHLIVWERVLVSQISAQTLNHTVVNVRMVRTHLKRQQNGKKKIEGYLKLQVPAGAASPSPPDWSSFGSTWFEHHGIL